MEQDFLGRQNAIAVIGESMPMPAPGRTAIEKGRPAGQSDRPGAREKGKLTAETGSKGHGARHNPKVNGCSRPRNPKPQALA